MAAYAQAPAATPAPAPEPILIPAPGGEVVLPDARAQASYDRLHYAASRRVGDMLYISGVIAAKAPDATGGDIEAYKVGLRSAFRRLEQILKASGAGFGDVVMLNTFHVWDSPHFSGSREEHFAAFAAVKDEFMPPPHPAWTAVGTTGLLAETGLVEIQMIVRLPPR